MKSEEQIKIHGVNVSKCLHYEKENKEYTCRLNHTPFHYRHCEDNPNCYFKQHARKTQECEKIKEKYEALRLENQEGYEIVAELKQECEELKKRATIAEDNFACEVQARLYHQNEWLKFSKECEELKKQLETSEEWRIKAESLNEKLELRNARYRKALEEIEEYINNQGINHKWNMYIQRFRQKILDIISKAKDGE